MPLDETVKAMRRIGCRDSWVSTGTGPIIVTFGRQFNPWKFNPTSQIDTHST